MFLALIGVARIAHSDGRGAQAGMDVGMEFLIAVQGWIRQSITADLNAFAATRDWAALFLVLPLGVAFGAVHALTPGHGKTVLASYLVGSRLAVLRGLGVAGALALTHVGSAVIIAVTAAPLITRTLGGAGQAPLLEALSRGLLGLIGVWFLVRAIRGQVHQHREGLMVGIVAGLIPCPLTLFAMFLALDVRLVCGRQHEPARQREGRLNPTWSETLACTDAPCAGTGRPRDWPEWHATAGPHREGEEP
jgi:ABC-type nickel/cobalt efflux system permease component RcnA